MSKVWRSVLAAFLVVGWSLLAMSATSAREGIAPVLFQALGAGSALAQQYEGQPGARMLAPPGGGSDWQAAKAARNCAPGGTVLRVDASGSGYNVRVLVGSQVVVVRVDAQGNCY